MANKKKKKTKSAFEVLDQRRNEQIAQMSKGSASTYKKLNKMLAPSSKEQISTGGIKTNNQTSIDYASNNTRDVSRQIIAPTSSLTSNTSNPVELVQNMQAQQENERQKRKVEQLKKKVEKEKQEKGILTPTEMQDIAVSENFGSKKNYLPSGVEKEKTQLDKQREKVTGHEIKKAIAPISEVAKKNTKLNDEYQKTSNTYKRYTEAANEQKFTEYLANQEKVNNEDTTLLDKINPMRAILVGLEEATTIGTYKDKNGNNVLLPSYSKLKEQKVAKDSGLIGKAYHGAMESVGAMIPSIAASVVPGAGTVLGPATTWATSFNSAQNDKLLEGYSKEDAEKYAVINATLEAGLGKAMGGITKTIGGKSSPLSKNIKKLTDKVFKNKGASYFASHAVSELAEEETQTFLDPINEHLTLGKYDSIGEALNSVELEDVGLTALSTLMTMGLTEGKTSYDISKLERNINKVNKKYGTDFKLKDNKLYRENLVSEKEYNNRVQELEAKGTKLTKEEKNKIKKETQEDLQNGNISIDTIESVFAENEYNKYKQEETKLNDLKKQIQELDSKKISELTVKEYDELKAKKTTLEDQIKSLENSTSKQELQAKMSDVLRSDDSVIQKSYEKELKVKSFKDSAKQYWNESEDSKSAIDTIEKVIRDKNYNITLDPTIKTKTGKEVAGRITTNENGEVDIRLNPNSNRTVEFLLTHEITHAIETDKMKNLVMDYAKKNKEFDTALNELKKTYEAEYVSDEVLADISGQLLGNQDFILNLSTKKPNIFKKIYDKIISVANKITGNSKEDLFIKDLKNKWEEAYRNVSTEQSVDNLNGETKLHTNSDISSNIDKVLNNIKERTPIKLRDYTPKILVDSGIKNLPMYENPSHIRKNILTEQEARKLGLAINKNDHYHGLGKDLYIKAIDSLDNPRVIFKRNNGNNYLILTTLKDNRGNNIIIPIEIETSTSVNNITIDINRLKSVYGYDRTNPNLNEYIKYNITNSNFTKIYEQKKKSSTGKIPQSTSTKDNISQSDTKVKSNTSSTKYSMQENKNDTQELDNSSFSIDDKGRKLAKSQQEYFKDSKVRDENGNLKVLYHGTPNDFTKFSYDKLGTNGTLLGKGFYLTDDINVAKAYANKGEQGKVMELYADIKKPLKWGETTITKQQFRSFVETVNQATEGRLFADYSGEYSEKGSTQYNSTLNDILMDYEYGGDDIDLVSGILNETGMSWNKGYKILKDTTGYDGIIVTTDVYDSGEGNVYIPFQSNQIKNVDNTNPTSDEDIRYSKENQTWQEHLEKNYKATGKRTNMADLRKTNSSNTNTSNNTNKAIVPIRKGMKPYLEMGEIVKKDNDPNYVPKIPIAEPELKKNQIAPIVKKESKLGQLKEKAAETIHTGQYLLTNKNEAIDRFSDKVGNKNIKILADHVNNVQGEISTNINNAQIDNNGKKIGKSIVDIFEPARKEKLTDAFNDYLFNLSNISRHKQGKGSLIPLNESETLVKEYEKAYPQMKEWAKDVNNYNKNLLYKQAEAGLISKDTADYFNKKYSFYVPFIENIDTIRTNDTGKIMTKSTVKTARGGSSKNLLAFEEAMIRQTQSAITNMRKNQLYNEIIDSIPEKTLDFESNTDPNISGNNLTTDKQNYLLSSYKDGKMQQAKIDKDLYEGLEDKFGNSLKKLEQKFSLVTKPLQKISNVRRNILTTWSPTFIITNPLKDIQDAPLNSKYGATWIKNYPKAMKELTTGKGEHLEEFLNMYGQGNLWGGENVDSGVFNVSNIAKTNKKAPSNNKAVKISKAMVKKTTQLNEIMEMGPRYAEYLASLEHGTSQMEALYNAREVTTNFGRGGVITKALNRNGFTFLNASVQGFSKLIRNFSGENGAKGVISASAKAVALGVAPALFNALWFDDDDDYNDLPDYIKDNYYLFKTDDNDFIRIPKGRMISIFGSAARRTLERTEGKRNEMTLKEDIKSYGKNAWSQVGVGDLSSNNIFAPINQAAKNEAWYGGDIVPSRLQDKPAEDQYDSSIDKASIWIGKKLGISPYKVNYVIDQYSGGIGDMILPVMTDEAQSDSNSVIGTALAPLRDKFTANSILDNKNVSNFYTKNDQLKVIANGSKATNKDKLVNQYMKSVSSDMGALYQEMREVQENNKLSKSEKFKKALIIKEEINKLAKEGMNSYSKVENVDNYGIVGNREFYKWTNDEGEEVWSAPKDKDLETLNSLGLTVKEKGNYYKTQSAMYDAWDKYDDYNVSKSHAIKSIINSSLPDDAKYQLYNNSYSKDEINIAQTIGIDADTFLNYAKQNFKANKDSNGKSISGSKKRKVYNYLNKMNVNYEDRLVLAKMQGYETEEGNAEIVNYLNNSNVTPDEYEAILKQLKFTIKNGYVRW